MLTLRLNPFEAFAFDPGNYTRLPSGHYRSRGGRVLTQQQYQQAAANARRPAAPAQGGPAAAAAPSPAKRPIGEPVHPDRIRAAVGDEQFARYERGEIKRKTILAKARKSPAWKAVVGVTNDVAQAPAAEKAAAVQAVPGLVSEHMADAPPAAKQAVTAGLADIARQPTRVGVVAALGRFVRGLAKLPFKLARAAVIGVFRVAKFAASKLGGIAKTVLGGGGMFAGGWAGAKLGAILAGPIGAALGTAVGSAVGALAGRGDLQGLKNLVTLRGTVSTGFGATARAIGSHLLNVALIPAVGLLPFMVPMAMSGSSEWLAETLGPGAMEVLKSIGSGIFGGAAFPELTAWTTATISSLGLGMWATLRMRRKAAGAIGARITDMKFQNLPPTFNPVTGEGLEGYSDSFETFAWEDWKPGDNGTMVSPGGRKLKKATYDRLAALAKTAPPKGLGPRPAAIATPKPAAPKAPPAPRPPATPKAPAKPPTPKAPAKPATPAIPPVKRPAPAKAARPRAGAPLQIRVPAEFLREVATGRIADPLDGLRRRLRQTTQRQIARQVAAAKTSEEVYRALTGESSRSPLVRAAGWVAHKLGRLAAWLGDQGIPATLAVGGGLGAVGAGTIGGAKLGLLAGGPLGMAIGTAVGGGLSMLAARAMAKPLFRLTGGRLPPGRFAEPPDDLAALKALLPRVAPGLPLTDADLKLILAAVQRAAGGAAPATFREPAYESFYWQLTQTRTNKPKAVWTGAATRHPLYGADAVRAVESQGGSATPPPAPAQAANAQRPPAAGPAARQAFARRARGVAEKAANVLVPQPVQAGAATAARGLRTLDRLLGQAAGGLLTGLGAMTDAALSGWVARKYTAVMGSAFGKPLADGRREAKGRLANAVLKKVGRTATGAAAKKVTLFLRVRDAFRRSSLGGLGTAARGYLGLFRAAFRANARRWGGGPGAVAAATAVELTAGVADWVIRTALGEALPFAGAAAGGYLAGLPGAAAGAAAGQVGKLLTTAVLPPGGLVRGGLAGLIGLGRRAVLGRPPVSGVRARKAAGQRLLFGPQGGAEVVSDRDSRQTLAAAAAAVRAATGRKLRYDPTRLMTSKENRPFVAAVQAHVTDPAARAAALRAMAVTSNRWGRRRLRTRATNDLLKVIREQRGGQFAERFAEAPGLPDLLAAARELLAGLGHPAVPDRDLLAALGTALHAMNGGGPVEAFAWKEGPRGGDYWLPPGEPDAPQNRLYGEAARAAAEAARHAFGAEPDADGKVPAAGGRTASFRPDAGGVVRIDFDQHGNVMKSQPALQGGSLDFLRRLQAAVAHLAGKRVPLAFSGADVRRERMYGQAARAVGYVPVGLRRDMTVEWRHKDNLGGKRPLTDAEYETLVKRLPARMAELERFAWEDWTPGDNGTMVSPGGRTLKKATYDRLKGLAGTAAPKPAAARRADGVRAVDPATIAVDPERFQFKQGANAAGVTPGHDLKGAKFNRLLSGVLSVWRDPADGKLYVVNGHHRLEMAKRDGALRVDVRVIPAPTAQAARAVGALQNIAGGRGTAVDAAKFLRDSGTTPEQLAAQGVSLKGAVARDAAALVRLDPVLFGKVARGAMDVPTAVALTGLAGHDDQRQLAAIVARHEERTGRPVPPAQVADMAKDFALAARAKTTGTLFDGLGGEDERVFVQRAALKAFIRAQLAKEANDFKTGSSERRAAVLGAAGNQLDTRTNARLAAERADLLHTFETDSSLVGPLSDELNRFAVLLHGARNPDAEAGVRVAALTAVRKLLAGQPAPKRGGKAPALFDGVGELERFAWSDWKPKGGTHMVSPGGRTLTNATFAKLSKASPSKSQKSPAAPAKAQKDQAVPAKAQAVPAAIQVIESPGVRARQRDQVSPALSPRVVAAEPRLSRAMKAKVNALYDKIRGIDYALADGLPDHLVEERRKVRAERAELVRQIEAILPPPPKPATTPPKTATTPVVAETAKPKTLADTLLARAEAEYPQFVDKYLAKYGTKKNGRTVGVTLNTDEWRSFFPEYTGTNAPDTHAAASHLNNRLFQDALSWFSGEGNRRLLVLAGGGGSGKGSAEKMIPLDEYPIRLDQVSDDFDKLMKKFDLGKQNGFAPEYAFVDRAPNLAWQGVVGRAVNGRSKGGIARTVPLQVALKANLDARAVAIRVLKERPDIPARVVDNNGGPGDARMIADRGEAIRHLERQQHDYESLLRRLTDETNRQPDLPEDIRQALVGPRPADGGSVQPERPAGAPGGRQGADAPAAGPPRRAGGEVRQGRIAHDRKLTAQDVKMARRIRAAVEGSKDGKTVAELRALTGLPQADFDRLATKLHAAGMVRLLDDGTRPADAVRSPGNRLFARITAGNPNTAVPLRSVVGRQRTEGHFAERMLRLFRV